MVTSIRHDARYLSWLRGLVAMVLLAQVSGVQAWVLNIGAGPRQVYLQVGNGALNANVATVNRVSLSIPVGQLGNNSALAMSSDSTVANSPLDNYTVCVPTSGQVYVGSSYRRANATEAASANLQVTSPLNLTNASGDVIPFNTISWTSTSIGNSGIADIPAGTFNGGTLFLRNIAANTFLENCHTFSYSNNAVRAAGTYDGRVTYTLVSP